MSTESIPELIELGQALQQARLQQGLSVDELSERLNMGREQLQSIELADSSSLPEPVFVIAQARRVAHSLGIDVDAEVQALRASKAFVASRPNPAQRQQLQQSSSSGHEKRRSSTFKALAIVGLVAGVVSGGIAVQRHGLPLSTFIWSDSPSAKPIASISEEAPPAEQGQVLRLKTDRPSWVEVRTDAGVSLFRGTLQGGQTFPLNTDLLVLAGRPDLVTVTVDGTEARKLGQIEDVTWHRFKASRQDPANVP